MVSYILVPLNLAAQAYTIGDQLQVSVEFAYTVGEDVMVYLYAAPYYSDVLGAGGKARGNGCTNYVAVELPQAVTPTSKTATVTFPLTPKASGGIDDGTYGLAVWLQTLVKDQDPWAAGADGVLAQIEDDNLLIVSGNPSSGGLTDTLSSMLPMLMMLMMVGMMTPIMQGFGGGN
jgi:hypothetical protein